MHDKSKKKYNSISRFLFYSCVDQLTYECMAKVKKNSSSISCNILSEFNQNMASFWLMSDLLLLMVLAVNAK